MKKVTLRSSGFSLLELQVYLCVIAVMAVMVCQVILMYHHVYDKIAVSARNSVALLSAVFQVNQSFDYAVLHQKKGAQLSAGSFFKKNKVVAEHNRNSVILDDVTSFQPRLDIQHKRVCGADFTCRYQNKRISWYRAALTKAFSCSLSS